MSATWHIALTCLLTTLCLAMILRGAIRLRETTLLAPCIWAAAFFIATCTSESVFVWISPTSTSLTSVLRFAGRMTCFCPVMALLGAKRPQNRAWQFIVLTLWLILIMPALEALAFGREGYLQVRDARGVFLWILILVGLVNTMATRFGIAGMLIAGGQVVLLAEYLPGLRMIIEHSPVVLGLVLVTGGIGLVSFGLPKRKVALVPENQLWFDFRDMYGAVWALRIAERINASAEQHHWNLRLQWSGITGTQECGFPDSVDESTRVALRKSMRVLLRRFVSVEWIRERYSDERSV